VATLSFSLPAASRVEAAVFDVAGRKVRELGAGRFAAGAHELSWDGRDTAGRAMPSGVYFVRLDRGSETLVTRMVRLD
jgi:flagellar hook assembly protein FlgD